MLSVASVASTQVDPARAVREIEAALETLGPGRTAISLVFATPEHGPSYAPLERAIRGVLGNAQVVGCSAAGVLSLGGEHRRGSAVAALALRGEFEAQRFFIPSLRGRAEEVGREIGRLVTTIDAEPRTVLLLADSYNLAPDELLAGVESAAPGTVVLGAGASENGLLGETTVIGHGASSSNAAAGFVLGGLDVRHLVAQSAAPVGRWTTVTRAEGNRIFELDGKPALDVFLDEIPELLREDLRETLRRTRAALVEESAAEVAEPPYVVRRLLGVDASYGTIAVGDEVIVGSRFAVAVSDPATAREGFSRAVERFATKGPPIIGALYFDSVERGESLYGIADLDIAYLRHALGDLALAGFFCGAEIAPLGGRNRFHDSSGVLVGFSDA